MIDELTSLSGNYQEDPFKLVMEDLKQTKEFAIERILKTTYSQIEEASHYNLELKGKNFRSAILFTLARAIHANNLDVLKSDSGSAIRSFENTN